MRVGASDPGATPDAASEPGSSPWDEAIIAARLLAVDPVGLGGAVLTAGPGPVRDLWLDILRLHLPEGAPFRRMPASIEDDRLLGGVDLVATLKLGRPVIQSGILAQADGGVVVIPMAERLAVGIAARIAGAIDRGDVLIERDGVARRVQARIGVIALNEAVSSDEAVPAALLDRLAFHLDLSLIRPLGIDEGEIDDAATTAARERLAAIAPASDAILSALVVTAARFGIPSVVAPLLALRAARAAAALAGRDRIEAEDAILAARLVLAPRALTNATLPGAHDAGAYWLSDKLQPGEESAQALAAIRVARALGVPVAHVARPWGTAQTLSVAEQLCAGVRYLDVRAGWDRDRGGWYVHHFLMGHPLSDVFADVADWLRSPGSGGDIVAIEVQHVIGAPANFFNPPPADACGRHAALSRGCRPPQGTGAARRRSRR